VLIELVVGDWSKDGHNQMDKYVVQVLGVDSAEELESAYNIGCKKVGLGTLQQYCRGYEENDFPVEFIRIIDKLAVGFGFVDAIEFYESASVIEGELTSLDPDSYVLCYLVLARFGNPDIRFDIQRGSFLHIGGHGLYS
jgi:hypothetical protein